VYKDEILKLCKDDPKREPKKLLLPHDQYSKFTTTSKEFFSSLHPDNLEEALEEFLKKTEKEGGQKKLGGKLILK